MEKLRMLNKIKKYVTYENQFADYDCAFNKFAGYR